MDQLSKAGRAMPEGTAKHLAKALVEHEDLLCNEEDADPQ